MTFNAPSSREQHYKPADTNLSSLSFPRNFKHNPSSKWNSYPDFYQFIRKADGNTCNDSSHRKNSFRQKLNKDSMLKYNKSSTHYFTLKPLYFEVPISKCLHICNRSVMCDKILLHLQSKSNFKRGLFVVGGPGAGKTILTLSLVERSCFAQQLGQKKAIIDDEYVDGNDLTNNNELSSRHLGSCLVAYHFCQSENYQTCIIPTFVQNLAAQLSQAPQLTAYYNLIQSDQKIQNCLTQSNCQLNPSHALTSGVLEPLTKLHIEGKITGDMMIVMVDGLCEAEQLKTDQGETLTVFLARHIPQFPWWLKLICTMRTDMSEYGTSLLPFSSIE